MAEFLDLPTLIVIGLAIVILFRLRSVLGTRTGTEKPPVDRFRRDAAKDGVKADDTVVPMRPRPVETPSDDDAERRARKLESEIETFSRGDAGLAQSLRQVVEVDPSFSPKGFLEGAKAAYEMIVTAFAAGDKKTLRNLLEKDVYDGFERVIDEREAAGHSIDFTFVGLPRIEISDASADKKLEQVTVRFYAEVVSATRAKDGTLIEGNADQVANIADEWTFARSPKSRDPNWKLAATSQLE
ncbi:Predicted lipid-binding transport protein, Tim44 family [Devosia enhydra]|uniref:Predicted lipid-binding transport protein, Tim44 family n=1 Tax=Devosia enhydra TaxID=665118 RepID=A0A1K2HYP3_9HYPH|nr:Tim44/TimA family putative adaptor protein [Devosia enhydra]SFZ85055.1 Predicted lipid-binding transport protein, Tim44 family [Devosia enhydra]